MLHTQLTGDLIERPGFYVMLQFGRVSTDVNHGDISW